MSVRARGRRQIAIKQQRKPGYALSTRPSSRLGRAAALSAVAEREQGKGPTIRSSKTQLPAVGRLHESGSAQAASLKLSLYKRLEGRSMKRSVDLRPIPARLLHRSPGIETLPRHRRPRNAIDRRSDVEAIACILIRFCRKACGQKVTS